MGVLCEPMLKQKTGRNSNPPFPSERMSNLFYEFLGRYNEWKVAKLQEMMAFSLVLLLGTGILLFSWFLPGSGITLSLVVGAFFYFAVRYYLKVSRRVSHIYINLHILHHHLLGKLEVGFCEHREPCECVENFRNYVLENHQISLDKSFLR